MITPEIKDRILIRLVSSEPIFAFNIPKDAAELGITEGELRAILTQMNNEGIVNGVFNMGIFFSVSAVNAAAHDKMARGGYSGQELVHNAGIEELGLRIDSLQIEIDHLRALVREEKGETKKRLVDSLAQLAATARACASLLGLLHGADAVEPLE